MWEVKDKKLNLLHDKKVVYGKTLGSREPG